MATRITLKSALEQLEALRHNMQLVETERDSLKAQLAAIKPAAPTKPAFVRRGPTEAQREAHDAYVAALLRAKDQAIKSGRSVVVG